MKLRVQTPAKEEADDHNDGVTSRADEPDYLVKDEETLGRQLVSHLLYTAWRIIFDWFEPVRSVDSLAIIIVVIAIILGWWLP